MCRNTTGGAPVPHFISFLGDGFLLGESVGGNPHPDPLPAYREREWMQLRSRRMLAGFFDLFAGVFPAADAGGEVLDVGVAEGDGFLGGGFVGHALGAAAVGDDQGVFVFGEHFFELGGAGFEVDGGGDVAVFVGISAVGVDD